MNKTIVARWQDWSDKSLEHLVLREMSDTITAEAVVIATVNGTALAARYRISCDTFWRVKEVEIGLIGDDRSIGLLSDGVGNWTDGTRRSLPHLKGAIDIDLSITPFTNTLPIRRLNLQLGQSADLMVVYVQFPDINITTNRQRYTCLELRRLYRYESIDSKFVRDIAVDDQGLVVRYPGLFKKLL